MRIESLRGEWRMVHGIKHIAITISTVTNNNCKNINNKNSNANTINNNTKTKPKIPKQIL
jgi:hypothetical protein